MMLLLLKTLQLASCPLLEQFLKYNVLSDTKIQIIICYNFKATFNFEVFFKVSDIFYY